MALGAALLFLYAVKKDWFRDVEEAKYQVFWSDLEEMVDRPLNKRHEKQREKTNGTQPTKSERHG